MPPEPLTRGLPPPDPRSLCPLSSTEFVESPPSNKISGYATVYVCIQGVLEGVWAKGVVLSIDYNILSITVHVTSQLGAVGSATYVPEGCVCDCSRWGGESLLLAW